MNWKRTFLKFTNRLLAAGAMLLTGAGWATPALSDTGEDLLFENSIRPVLVEACFGCHGGSKLSAGLRVDSREALLAGGDSGAAITPGAPDESLLLSAIRRHDGVSAMPPDEDKALRPDQTAAFEAWIRAGAPWPENSTKFESVQHWAFQPVVDAGVPMVQDRQWIRQPLDAYIRTRQEAAGVRPAAAADKRTLIRRATFDLLGLPPTADEIAAFESDPSPDAFEKVIDRLLASPRYGERWGRHWLDVVRYADTAGETADYPVPLAWRYRNYVIDALNADKPYDQFLREQIAGDVMAEGSTGQRYAELVTATGYLAISRRFGFDSENYHHLTIQDTLDTLGQSVLGLSIGCARCHDHKFDAISMRDYYALYGIFDSSRYAFPGSEQKQKFRAMVPLLPVAQSMPKWREFERRTGAIAARLAKAKQPVPAAVLRSLNDIDGDFETQAPAAGGSNGVLVAPWLYQGKIAVTNAAQSPFENLYGRGNVGVSIAAATGPYVIEQALYPRRSSDNCDSLYVNLDFRVGSTDAAASGHHRLLLGSSGALPAVAVLISADSVSLSHGNAVERIGAVEPGQWHNLQLNLKLREQTLSGSLTRAGSTSVDFADSPLPLAQSQAVDLIVFDSPRDSHSELPSELPQSSLPAIEYDNVAVQETQLPSASGAPPSTVASADEDEAETIAVSLRELAAADGDFELQSEATPPGQPWGPGPNSVVQITTSAQSPFRNLFPAGTLGVHMPNRGAYDGFGISFPSPWNSADTQRLHASVDLCFASDAAGGEGSWRYYIGHGPGNSAAVELFFNGHQFFRRSGAAIDPVCDLSVGQWYQVQLTLDLQAKRYAGTIQSSTARTEFDGEMAAGWDGVIDNSFIDSYGHLGGVRPELYADNYVIRTQELPPTDGPAIEGNPDDNALRRQRVAELRKRLTDIEQETRAKAEQLNQLLAEGPVAMTYGVVEGTPHNVRIHLRGEPGQLGEEVPRGFIKALGPETLPANVHGSGRLELAQWCTSAENPLTARVMVNRIWQYHFGQGLVKTPNDFGVRGQRPTHPELLDHLAAELIRSGWSVKAMHRKIMLSATYTQSSLADRSDGASSASSPLKKGSDPLETSLEHWRTATLERVRPLFQRAASADSGELYHHFPARRLSAEEIRDAILLVTSELDSVPGQEHPFPSPTSWGFSQHAPFSAVYQHDKRSIYLMTQRIKRHPFLALFDGPDPNATTAERLRTTVPTQALFFLNDPFIHAKADAWATRLLAGDGSVPAQLDQAYRTALGRQPTAEELQEAQEFLATYRAELDALQQANSEARALAAFLRTLLGSNEFLHVD